MGRARYGFLLAVLLSGCAEDAPSPSAASATTAATAPSASAAPRASAWAKPERTLAESLASIRADPPPPATTRGAHFVVSNEDDPHHWAKPVSQLGGMLIGVGAEQNLILAGWARSEALVCLDFDQWVVDLNRAHGLILSKAGSPAEWLELWNKSRADEVRGWIERAWPDDAKRIADVVRRSRYAVYKRLVKVRDQLAKQGTASLFDDRAQFDHVRGLWKRGAAVSVLGNLLEKKALSDAGRAAREQGMPVRVLYLSNAEFYFDYADGAFTPNVLGLPSDDRSVVLHTRPIDEKKFHYAVQPLGAFQKWLRSGKAEDFHVLFRTSRDYERRYDVPFHQLDALPPE